MSIDKRNSAGASTTVSNINKFEHQVQVKGQKVFDLDFLLTENHLVLQNMGKTNYTGIGTYQLILTVGANLYDDILIIG